VSEPAWTLATRFFDLPLADKLSVARPTPDYPYGYILLAGESLSQSVAGVAPPDLKEVFNIGPHARPAASQPARCCIRTSPALVLVVGDVLAPVRLRPPAAGGLGDGQMGHEVVRRGAVPVPLAGRRANDLGVV
jgi:hypothetical protein